MDDPDFGSKLCFVLMPFADAKNLPEVWQDVIRDGVFADVDSWPLAGEYRCLRADDIFDNKAIIDDIVRQIHDADVVIADLTSRNPNVMYELGRAHEMAKECILIAQSLKDVPFDLQHLRVITYSSSGRGLEKLKKDLQNTIAAIDARRAAQSPETSSSSKIPRKSFNVGDVVYWAFSDGSGNASGVVLTTSLDGRVFRVGMRKGESRSMIEVERIVEWNDHAPILHSNHSVALDLPADDDGAVAFAERLLEDMESFIKEQRSLITAGDENDYSAGYRRHCSKEERESWIKEAEELCGYLRTIVPV